MHRFNQQRTPFLIPIWLMGFAALIAFTVALSFAWVWLTADTTTVVVAPVADDAVLRRMLEGFPGPGRVDSVYRAEPKRTSRETARNVLRDHRGGRVLMLAETGEVNNLVEALSGSKVPELPVGAHVLYAVTVPRIGDANVLRLNY